MGTHRTEPNPLSAHNLLNDRMGIYLDIRVITLLSSREQGPLHPHCYLKIEEVFEAANESKYIAKCQSALGSRTADSTGLKWVVNQKLSTAASSKIILKIIKPRRIISDQIIMSIPVSVIDILTHLIHSDSTFTMSIGSNYTLTMDVEKNILHDVLDHITLCGPLSESLNNAQQSIDIMLTNGLVLGENSLFFVVAISL
ncbi:hypothetical protein BDN72DRAFT_688034 [Pluteus cervinus]|uniref:Uncharacterized protein n=1 Tax=Pluteus cervinus TaxID=181527 RepID=A0ACD3AS79_9AGAR|nr:hypothetical protein BDN72DRAFT_688034 [Pluteus cervinus]